MSLPCNTLNLFVFPDGRMDRKNAAQYLGCAPKTLADWATKGIGPEYRLVGGRVFYFKAALDEWIGGRCVSSSSNRQRPGNGR
jgi:hypothetical protein